VGAFAPCTAAQKSAAPRYGRAGVASCAMIVKHVMYTGKISRPNNRTEQRLKVKDRTSSGTLSPRRPHVPLFEKPWLRARALITGF